jgi:hypothetical protein
MNKPIVSRETFSFTDEQLSLIVEGLQWLYQTKLVSYNVPKEDIISVGKLYNSLCPYTDRKPIPIPPHLTYQEE